MHDTLIAISPTRREYAASDEPGCTGVAYVLHLSTDEVLALVALARHGIGQRGDLDTDQERVLTAVESMARDVLHADHADRRENRA